MKRIITLSLFAFAVAGALSADCTAFITAYSTTNITINCATTDDKLAVGDPVTIKAGDQSIATIATKVRPTNDPNFGTFLVVTSIDPDPGKLQLINNGGTVIVKAGTKTFDAKVESTFPNYFRYTWAVGPATTGAKAASTTGTTTTPIATTGAATASNPPSGAIRLKYSGQYASSGMFGTKVGSVQTLATLDIDTTDQKDPSFIDNNRATLSFQWNLPPADFLKQGTIGFEGSATKAAHKDIRDIDAALAIGGWLPVLRTLNLFNREGDFISAPLSFTASYGYKNRNLQGETFHGKVFEATALYHIFAVDRYKLDIDGKWTVNDLSNRPASTPRSQRLYKATISYLADPSKGFSVQTTIENGSAGVMLTKVRQYFVGLALSKLNFSGKSK